MQCHCHCQSGSLYSECCEIYHSGQAAPTAEALMRARYSAFVINNDKYLYKSWSKITRPSKKSLRESGLSQWLGLSIVRVERGTLFDSEGVVEFIARFVTQGKKQQLHEVSRFIRENGQWVYVDGD